MSVWAIDLGTTNTGVARWDPTASRPRLIDLPEISRRPGSEDPLEAPRLVPSATHAIEALDLWSKIGRWPILDRRVHLGRQAYIGRQALERNEGAVHPSFAPSFKPLLSREALRPLARVGRQPLSARDVGQMFVRELLREIKLVTGERVRDVVLTAPVDSYESYRAELLGISRRLGVKKVRFIDEPVAAALGYGLGLGQSRRVLVVDFGGGTLHFVLVVLEAKGVESGTCRVIAKEARGIGGTTVDRWLLEEFAARMSHPLPTSQDDEDAQFWLRLMLAEACRVKESLFFNSSETFYLIPIHELGRFDARLMGKNVDTQISVSKDDLIQVLTQRGLYKTLEDCLEGIQREAARQGIDKNEFDDVLLVGGSTLLPNVYPFFEERFGRDRVRGWQPFEAVAYGACAFAAGAFRQADFIVHDYAFVTYDPRSHQREYTVIVPRGTRFPTASDLWKRQLVPTCSLGEPEKIFKLVICEIGRSEGNDRRFGWDASGQLHKLSAGDSDKSNGDGALIVALNESNPTLGYLDPPHPPSDRRPRLEISFGVNGDRWLIASVHDLRTKKWLMREEPVVRLL
jgi:molecular chaperone DnaK (HSP70)